MGIGKTLLDLLFPPRCPFCGVLLRDGDFFCPICRETLPWIHAPENYRRVDFTEGCVSSLRYDGSVREAVHRYKFKGKSAYCFSFGAIIAETISQNDYRAEVLTYPPLSAARYRERGYDQAERLAKAAGAVWGQEPIPTLIKREVPAQSGLTDASARRANVMGAYSVRDESAVRGKSILLIDDVVTTGSTLAECAKVILAAGAREIRCATLAQA